MSGTEVIPVIHNISSVPKMVEYARVAIGYGFNTIVYSRVFGAAAQQGIGEVFKMALRHNASIVVLPDINDVVDLLKPDTVLFVSRPHRGSTLFTADLVKGRTMIVVNGSDLPFVEEEVRRRGLLVHVEDADIGSLGQFVLLLNNLRKR